ncbi:YceI family protein [Kutzneria buriramensis]|uniref:Polyisoprenoid-binding protein YceI n=1 Tax=Kutzneria buriramensis TaxID=1045776 RepID=A0A3E0HFP4_9PSEU|nr:YceI family protein [Kutzneria buriramensis]REH44610.1 polyisoprenoid-binding protein YceI [Kutzneria buriramensis]
MTAATQIPGYVAGTWNIDPVHSDVAFIVRHLGVSKVRGRFNTVSGTIVTGEDPSTSTVTATIQADSIDTKNEQRDGHVKSPDFLHVEEHEHLSFTSTAVRIDGEEIEIDGDLTLHGVTKPVTLTGELGGFGEGPNGKVLGVSATTEIKRSDFGVGGNIPAAVVSDKIKVELDVEAQLQA